MKTAQARIVHGVPGPAGEIGVLVVMPRSEALDWDLRDEVASTSRHWMPDREAWWVAAPYASTAIAIATRFNGGTPPQEEAAESAAPATLEAPPRGLLAGLRRLVARLWPKRGKAPLLADRAAAGRGRER